MQHRLTFTAACTLLCGALATTPALAAEPAGTAKKDERRPAAPTLRLLVPAYFYPAGEGAKHWEGLLAAADRVPIVAIVNPASGPGKAADPNYVKLLERAGKTKITLIAYVTTSYARRPLAEVKAEVDQWLRLYSGLHGVFLDEQASGGEHLDYYAALHEYIHGKPGLKRVVSNPGTTCDERFVSRPAADVVCLFEGPKPLDAANLPGWANKHKPERLSVLSYKVGDAKGMRRCLEAARERVGYVYVTDAEGANPWDRLPSYWDEEVTAVRGINGVTK
jgi:hypothetical protein